MSNLFLNVNFRLWSRTQICSNLFCLPVFFFVRNYFWLFRGFGPKTKFVKKIDQACWDPPIATLFKEKWEQVESGFGIAASLFFQIVKMCINKVQNHKTFFGKKKMWVRAGLKFSKALGFFRHFQKKNWRVYSFNFLFCSFYLRRPLFSHRP